MKRNQGQKGQFQYLGLKVKNDLKNEIFNHYYIMYALQYIKSRITFCTYFTLLSLSSKIVIGLDFGLDFVSRLKSEKMNKMSFTPYPPLYYICWLLTQNARWKWPTHIFLESSTKGGGSPKTTFFCFLLHEARTKPI